MTNMLLYQILEYTMHGKILKSHTKTIDLKNCCQSGIKNLNYLMDHIRYQIFNIILSISSKNMKHLLIILQIEYLYGKIKTEFLLKSRQDIILNF